MSFEALPRELQLIIITEHLRPPPPEPDRLSTPSKRPGLPRTIDIDLALQLAIVSPSCHDIVRSLLFRHVHITRPSSLQQLFSQLSRRPDLALLIKSIHLGPVRSGGQRSWPFLGSIYDWPSVYLQFTLSRRETETLVPSWCPPTRIFRIPPFHPNCAGEAANLAIEEAVKGLDIEPTRRGYSKSGICIGIRAWTARCFLLAAALDLYLIEMQRWESLHKYDMWRWEQSTVPAACQKGVCGHTYPRYQVSFEGCKLPLTGQDLSIIGSSNGGKTFTVSEAQLWAQLERPGGPADDFNHLTLFTNSTRSGLDMGQREWQRVRAALRGPCPQNFTNIDWLKRNGYDPYDELDELYLHPDDSEDEEDKDWPHPSCSASEDFDTGREIRMGRTDKAEDLLNMARRLLSLATEVKNLSLTGIFFRALPALQARSLRALTIGPHPRFWSEVLPFEAVMRLRSLVRLRVVGMISKKDASRIAHELPRLEHFEWEMLDEAASMHRVYDNVSALQGLRNPADFHTGRREEPPRKKPRHSFESTSDGSHHDSSPRGPSTSLEASQSDSSAAPHATPPQRRTLILLRPENVGRVCGMTPFQEELDSWQGDGHRLEHNLHGVQVIGSEAADPEVLQGREMAALYAAGQQWWRECNVGVGMFGREGRGEEEDAAKGTRRGSRGW